jgi:hypothetical protein
MSFPEWTLAMAMTTSTCESFISSPTMTAPRTSVKWPRTLVNMRWRPVKATSVWPGSISQTPRRGSRTPSVPRAASDLVVTGMRVSFLAGTGPACPNRCVCIHISIIGN